MCLKIIYLSQMGTFAAVAAAAMHLKTIDKQIQYQKFKNLLKNFDAPPYRPTYLGQDQNGCHIYALGISSEKQLVLKIIHSFEETFSASPGKKLITIDVTPQEGLLAATASFLLAIPYLKWVRQRLLPFLTWKRLAKIEDYIYPGISLTS